MGREKQFHDLIDVNKIAKRTHHSPESVIETIKRAKSSLVPKTRKFVITEEDSKESIAVTRIGVGLLQTEYGDFHQFEFNVSDKWKRYSVLLRNEIGANFRPVFEKSKRLLIRVDSGCQSGQVFRDKTCECDAQLHKAMKTISDYGQGILVHIPAQDGRGLGIPFKLVTLTLQAELKLDTVQAAYAIKAHPPIDGRTYSGVIAIMRFLSVPKDITIGLMTNNPGKYEVFRENGYNTVALVPIIIPPTKYTKRHLHAKQKHLGHKLDIKE